MRIERASTNDCGMADVAVRTGCVAGGSFRHLHGQHQCHDKCQCVHEQLQVTGGAATIMVHTGVCGQWRNSSSMAFREAIARRWVDQTYVADGLPAANGGGTWRNRITSGLTNGGQLAEKAQWKRTVADNTATHRRTLKGV